MDPFLKMDIFFAVATAVVLVIGLLVAYILVRIARIIRNVEKISHMVTDEGKLLREDIEELRMKAKTEGLKISQVGRFFKKQLRKFSGD